MQAFLWKKSQKPRNRVRSYCREIKKIKFGTLYFFRPHDELKRNTVNEEEWACLMRTKLNAQTQSVLRQCRRVRFHQMSNYLIKLHSIGLQNKIATCCWGQYIRRTGHPNA